MNITIEFSKNLTFKQKAHILEDWDEFQKTMVIPSRSLQVVENLKAVLYPKNPEELNTTFWFKELYVAVCRDFADSFVERINFDMLYIKSF